MGQIMSGFQEFRESLDPLTAPSTPSPSTETPKNDGKCRVLEVDPRSPTVDINRTPIQVQSTPNASRAVENDAVLTPIPFSMNIKERPKSLHQRIIEKKRPLENLENTLKSPTD